ncbi:Na+/melibiose symporter [Noviherbaspirillum humi]|uniref:Na+/melibiose symporter n=1 Tax=Noviherbaspirillum humi TaxID=1688639 RepID=A0A239CIB9_9BURK|nr:MFS transporter [Noviherbaspirillum humi]SNS19428.1 Na+/melibiose symporter [Noviherbaspirillum humi]
MTAHPARFHLFAYGAFGLPLALVALPIYIHVPQLYAQRFGMPLGAVGLALLATRLLDAFSDPLLGRWLDRAPGGHARFVLLALPPLGAGFVALFHPPAIAHSLPLAWLAAALLLCHAGFSMASIAHQSWGAALTQAPGQRSRVTAAREGCGLAGVLLGAGLLGSASTVWLSLAFALTLVASAWLLLRHAQRPAAAWAATTDASLMAPFANRQFRWLFAVFMVNGIAAAIPATLFLFFAGDRLRLGESSNGLLLVYFLAAAASMPAWSALARRHGEARPWLGAMLLALLSFIWSYRLAPGDALPFGTICLLSGIALGADLVLPPALLAAVIRHGGGNREGAYFGLWNWAGKLNLALAAGIVLPLLERLGYTPGTPGADTAPLAVAYAVLPCLLKLLAALLLWRAPLRHL